MTKTSKLPYYCIFLHIFFLNKAFSAPIKGPENKTEKMHITAIHFTKSFISKGSLIGLNFYQYFDVEKYKKTKFENTFKYVHRYYILGYHINHHFNGNAAIKYNSQSIEMTFYTTKQFESFNGEFYKMIGFGVNCRHYDLKYFTASPVIKIKPPLTVLYFQSNFKLNKPNEYNIPRYEFGIEINLNLWMNKMQHFDID